MELKDVKGKLKTFAKRATAAMAVGTMAFTVVATAATIAVVSERAVNHQRDVMINDPVCVQMVDTLEEAHHYKEVLEKAKANHDTEAVKEAQEALKKIVAQLSENGKYDGVEVFVTSDGQCRIQKWDNNNLHVMHEGSPYGDIVAQYDINLKNGNYKEDMRSIDSHYHLNTGTTLQDKLMRAAINVMNGKSPLQNQTSKASFKP